MLLSQRIVCVNFVSVVNNVHSDQTVLLFLCLAALVICLGNYILGLMMLRHWGTYDGR